MASRGLSFKNANQPHKIYTPANSTALATFHSHQVEVGDVDMLEEANALTIEFLEFYLSYYRVTQQSEDEITQNQIVRISEFTVSKKPITWIVFDTNCIVIDNKRKTAGWLGTQDFEPSFINTQFPGYTKTCHGIVGPSYMTDAVLLNAARFVYCFETNTDKWRSVLP
jgi:hypothetical protein